MDTRKVSEPIQRCILLLSIFISFTYVPVEGQTSNKGLYVLNFMNISTDRTVSVFQVINISSVVDTSIRLKFPAAGIDRYVDLDSSNNRQHSEFFDMDLGVPRGEHIAQSGALLTSQQATPIWVHTNKMEGGTTAAYLALPVTQNSTEFFIPSYKVGRGSNFHSGFAVAGLQDGSCVEIYKVKGDVYTRKALIHLDSLDVYSALDSTDDFDYTGYYVNSTRPLAVFAGHECAKIPVGVDYCDAVIEQVPAVTEYGTEFIIGPIAGRTQTTAGYEFRVIASDNDTLVSYTTSDAGATTVNHTIIDRGEFISREAMSTTSNVYLTCSKRCLVVQFNRGFSQVSGETTPTDPFMMVIPPLDHYDKDIRFPTQRHFSGGQISDSIDYLTIVAKDTDKNNMRLNGAQLTNTAIAWTQIVNRTDYYTTAIRLSVGYHTLTNTDPNSEYMAWVYGHGDSNTAYGFMAAYKITDGPVIDSSLYNFVEPTTSEPVTTQAPWVLGNWTSDFSTNELPQYGVYYSGNFSAVTRNGRVIEKVCSDGYKAFFVNKRLTSMSRQLTNNIDTICPGLSGSTVELMSSESMDMFYTEYTRGYLGYIVTLIGSHTSTFRQVQVCSTKLKAYVNILDNWPAVTTTVNGQTEQNTKTDTSNFLTRDGDEMENCDALELGIVSTDVEFRLVREAWICNGLNPDDILVLLGSASNMAPITLIQTCVLSLVVVFLFRGSN